MNAYSPRRQSKRWLDGDCPREILAIYYDKREPCDPYTIFYAELLGDGRRASIGYIALDENGRYFHGELAVYETAAFRYRNAHRACKWTSLPEAVRKAVKADIAAVAAYRESPEGKS